MAPGVRDVVLAGPDLLMESVKREVPGVKNFEDLPVRAAMTVVQNGDIGAVEALERERNHQNRKSLITWLESKIENPETQGGPF